MRHAAFGLRSIRLLLLRCTISSAKLNQHCTQVTEYVRCQETSSLGVCASMLKRSRDRLCYQLGNHVSAGAALRVSTWCSIQFSKLFILLICKIPSCHRTQEHSLHFTRRLSGRYGSNYVVVQRATPTSPMSILINIPDRSTQFKKHYKGPKALPSYPTRYPERRRIRGKYANIFKRQSSMPRRKDSVHP